MQQFCGAGETHPPVRSRMQRGFEGSAKKDETRRIKNLQSAEYEEAPQRSAEQIACIQFSDGEVVSGEDDRDHDTRKKRTGASMRTLSGAS